MLLTPPRPFRINPTSSSTKLLPSYRTQFTLLSFLLLMVFAGSATAKQHLGVPLPPGARKLSENRFKAPRGFWETVRWMESQLRKKKGIKVKFDKSLDLPDVVSAHSKSPSAGTRWSGINISEYGGSVKIFIIER